MAPASPACERTVAFLVNCKENAGPMTDSNRPAEVPNQSPPYADIDLYGNDRALQEAVIENGAEIDGPALGAFGRRWGSAAMIEMARLANEHPPRLKVFDAKGRRSDTVEFHPAYHHVMAESISA